MCVQKFNNFDELFYKAQYKLIFDITWPTNIWRMALKRPSGFVCNKQPLSEVSFSLIEGT